MNTTTETLTVNGVVLNTLAKNIETLAGRLRAPGKRTGNIQVSGRNGKLRASKKMYNENVLSLPMWVIGGDDDGLIPGGSTARREFYKRIDELTRLFLGTDTELDIRHTLPDGTVRQAFGDVLDVIDFSTSDNGLAKFGVNIEMADPFWYDLNTITQSVVANGASATFSSFAGATAPMEKLRFRFIGPWNFPVITFSDGSFLAYDGNIAASQHVTVNCDTWQLTGVGVSPTLAQLRRGGTASGRWATVPASATSPVITLAGTARTTATNLELFGRRAYLVG